MLFLLCLPPAVLPQPLLRRAMPRCIPIATSSTLRRPPRSAPPRTECSIGSSDRTAARNEAPFLPDNPKITRYEGTNPLSGKSVVIDYVTEGKKLLLRVSTFYPDTEHDINKPYIFTLDPGHAVKYISW